MQIRTIHIYSVISLPLLHEFYVKTIFYKLYTQSTDSNVGTISANIPVVTSGECCLSFKHASNIQEPCTPT